MECGTPKTRRAHDGAGVMGNNGHSRSNSPFLGVSVIRIFLLPTLKWVDVQLSVDSGSRFLLPSLDLPSRTKHCPLVPSPQHSHLFLSYKSLPLKCQLLLSSPGFMIVTMAHSVFHLLIYSTDIFWAPTIWKVLCALEPGAKICCASHSQRWE